MLDGEHDVFGDGSVVLLPTYGHTPGHQSLRVRAGKQSQIVCASDACYTRENMDRDVLPKILWNPSVMFESLKALRQAPRPGRRHDVLRPRPGAVGDHSARRRRR